MRRLVLALLSIGFLVGCTDNSDLPLAPTLVPQVAIDDGAHDGNPHFFFLSPMVPAPAPGGVFDPNLEPLVEVCVWSGASCGSSVALFNRAVGSGSESIRVDIDDQHYIVNWHTDEVLQLFPLGEGEVYRIVVSVDGQRLGYADVDVVAHGSGLKNVDTDEMIPLLDGRTLPIKFRIEEGALSDVGQGDVMAAGYQHTCAITVAGDAYCWGYNVLGALGNGTITGYEPVPQLVVGGHKFQSIAVGLQHHTCGVTTDNDLYCWGYNGFGQLGTGDRTLREPTPQLVPGGLQFAKVSTGFHHTCAVSAGGEAYCWGSNSGGQVGSGSSDAVHTLPQAVVGGNYVDVTAGAYHACGIAPDQTAHCWGEGWMLGAGYLPRAGSPEPLAVLGGLSFESVAAGGYHTCAVAVGGQAFCWGLNRYGQVGISEYQHRYSPNPVTGGLSFKTVRGGVYHTCGVTVDSKAYCWGVNLDGQLGNGSTTPDWPWGLHEPQLVDFGEFIAVDPGMTHSCGLRSGGEVYCWGGNRYGILGDGTTVPSLSPVLSMDLDPATP